MKEQNQKAPKPKKRPAPEFDWPADVKDPGREYSLFTKICHWRKAGIEPTDEMIDKAARVSKLSRMKYAPHKCKHGELSERDEAVNRFMKLAPVSSLFPDSGSTVTKESRRSLFMRIMCPGPLQMKNGSDLEEFKEKHPGYIDPKLLEEDMKNDFMETRKLQQKNYVERNMHLWDEDDLKQLELQKQWVLEGRARVNHPKSGHVCFDVNNFIWMSHSTSPRTAALECIVKKCNP